MAEITDRKKLIDSLLRRQFRSLAPPPVTTLSGGYTAPVRDRAMWKRDLAVEGRSNEVTPMDRQRAQYEAMSLKELQAQVEAAKAADLHKAQQDASQTNLLREARWQHWAKKDLWSEAEFAALCCGFVPDERGMPADPGRVAGSDQQAVAILRATDDIRRGTLSQTLAFVPRDDTDVANQMYGTARHYSPVIAAEWAATRFNAFPSSLLAAVRERKEAARGSAAATHGWPWGSHETDLLRNLSAAALQFWALYDPSDATTAPKNKDVVDWLKARGVAERNAQVMATVLRADGLPTGPRK
ncbi:hypothetical protein XpopCFBP1817_19755 [Xanthomonas populi]|uniref:Uncharacterized protein n=1 Tax=Xanthomonas populi TaxID=53414 RepID=A0A2S7E6X8_9XANT|nr:hypothetical protein [Xanthomonas populi]PPU85877.1 hypothetical protein XpopCFBP1817_19755 [Xanthomonas populi]